MTKEVLTIPARTRIGNGLVTKALADCKSAKKGAKLEVWVATPADIKVTGEDRLRKTGARIVTYLRKHGVFAMQRRLGVYAEIGAAIPVRKARTVKAKPVKKSKS